MWKNPKLNYCLYIFNGLYFIGVLNQVIFATIGHWYTFKLKWIH